MLHSTPGDSGLYVSGFGGSSGELEFRFGLGLGFGFQDSRLSVVGLDG